MKKVLLIDDDSRMLKLLQGYLEDSYTVYPVKGGNAALAFLNEHKPDVILLDYMMPALDGLHTLELLRKKEGCERIPVIFLTGVTEKNKMKECLSQGLDGYMVKPVAREELLFKLGEVLDR